MSKVLSLIGIAILQAVVPTTPNGIRVFDATQCVGVAVPISTTNIQLLVDAQPEGTTFCFAKGTYKPSSSILAKSRDQFLGQYGTVIDGKNKIDRGIWGYGGLEGQRDVVVRNIEFANFTGSAVHMGWYWTVSQSEMHHSQIGVEVNNYSTLDGNFIHDNKQYGVNGGPGVDFVITNNDIVHNNTSKDCAGQCVADAGGSKIVGSSEGTTGLVWRRNRVHGNIGPGIWSDGNVRALYEDNIVWDNTGAGIAHEISWDAVIRNNFLMNNDSANAGKSCWWGANILINTSSNVEVRENTILGSNGSNGICAVSADRPDVAPFSTVVSNFYAHDNLVYMNKTAMSGLVKGSAQGVLNNRFENNTYRVTDVTKSWWTWPTALSASWSAWRDIASQDLTGVLSKQ